MRRDLFSHLQTLPFRFYDKNRTGHLMSRMVNDLNEIAELATMALKTCSFPSSCLLALFMLMMVEWRLAIIVYLLVPVMTWFAFKYRKLMNHPSGICG